MRQFSERLLTAIWPWRKTVNVPSEARRKAVEALEDRERIQVRAMFERYGVAAGYGIPADDKKGWVRFLQSRGCTRAEVTKILAGDKTKLRALYDEVLEENK